MKYLAIKTLKLKVYASDYVCREHPQDCVLNPTLYYVIS